MMPTCALDGDFQVDQDITTSRRRGAGGDGRGRTIQLVFMIEILKEKSEVLTMILV